MNCCSAEQEPDAFRPPALDSPALLAHSPEFALPALDSPALRNDSAARLRAARALDSAARSKVLPGSAAPWPPVADSLADSSAVDYSPVRDLPAECSPAVRACLAARDDRSVAVQQAGHSDDSAVHSAPC
jgi:hypothetical protein